MTDSAPAALQDRFAPHNKCFGCGPANPKGLRLKTEFRDGVYLCSWRAETHHESFPGMLSGGICGTLLDCHSNWSAAHHLMQRNELETPPCTVTAEYAVQLEAPTPSGAEILLRAEILESSPRKAVVLASLSADGQQTCTCRGTFVAVREEHPAYHRW